MWWLVVIPTLHRFWRGTLFEAPCLATIPENYRQNVLKIKMPTDTTWKSFAASPDRVPALGNTLEQKGTRGAANQEHNHVNHVTLTVATSFLVLIL